MKSDSVHRPECLEFLEYLVSTRTTMTMPAHGWFEVHCSLKRAREIDKKFLGAPIGAEWNFPIELIHIDEKFLRRYGNVEMPYSKAGDHIYLVVAYVNGYPLVTTDQGMTKVAKSLGISVFDPPSYLQSRSDA